MKSSFLIRITPLQKAAFLLLLMFLDGFVMADGTYKIETAQLPDIELDRKVSADHLTLMPQVMGLSEGVYQYVMRFEKHGSGGNMTTRQQGEIAVTEGTGEQNFPLSQLSVNLKQTDDCDLLVVVMLKQKIVVEKHFNCSELF